jgi:DNA polymerase I
MMGLSGKEQGGENFAAHFSEIWCCDFEFRADPGERPWPVCLVAQNVKTGQVVRLWRDQLLAASQAPFNVGSDALLVAYFASAEFGCFLELGWELPTNVLDLFAEHRVQTNGGETLCGNGLLGALAMRGLARIDAGEKEDMRRLILDRRHWTEDEKRKILDYCQSDVTGTAALFAKMAPTIDWPRALIRGRYMKAVARMERTGVPVDAAMHRDMVANWDDTS